jgi:phosphonate transport system substrate-binding protein
MPSGIGQTNMLSENSPSLCISVRAARIISMIALTFILVLTLAPFANAQESLLPGESEFLIGLIPEENIFKQMQKHKLLGDYLSKELGIPVRFTILSRYPHIITRFISRNLDAAFFGAFTAVLANETLSIEPIARPVGLDGSMTTRGYLFTRKSTGIENISQMRGKSIAFVDQVTATGYLYALDLLKKNGVKDINNFFDREEYTGGHDTTVYTVLADRTELGVAKARIVDQVMKRDPMARSEIKILYSSPELPDNTLCVRKDLPEEFKLKLKNILLSMHKNPEGKKVLERFEALQFTIAVQEDFEPIRAMAKRVGIDLKKFEYDY